MGQSTLHIKNMVCNRCIKAVREELERLGFTITEIELGKVRLSAEANEQELNQIQECLKENGFELISDKRSQLVDRIKSHIIKAIHHSPKDLGVMLSSTEIAHSLGYDYSYLSSLFSSVEGITVEKYIINQKVEKIKELLEYGELSIKEIAFQLDYSSAQHLSNQFKKVSGISPSHFKGLKNHHRQPLDEV